MKSTEYVLTSHLSIVADKNKDSDIEPFVLISSSLKIAVARRLLVQ